MTNQRPSLAVFERQVAERKHAEAMHMGLAILQAIDERYGRLENVDVGAIVPGTSEDDIVLNFCTRLAAGLGQLLADPGFTFTPADFERLLINHRWFDLIFSLSGFRTSDHLLPVFASGRAGQQMNFGGNNFLRLLAALSLNSATDFNFEEFWRANNVAAGLAFLNYITTRYLFRPRAFQFRERLLEWLPERLDELRLGSMVLSRMPEIYMHCSYAYTPKKHAIKAPIMRQMRRACLEAGCKEISELPPKSADGRPTVVVVAEHLVPGHAVHRTHSLAIRSLRERFHVVGVIYPDPTGSEIATYFDECLVMPPMEFMSCIKRLSEEIAQRKPAMVFYLGVGMVPQVIALASLRMAPVQCVSFGHTATTMSPAIDYFVLPEDFVGDPSTFSEKVLALPKEAMPFALRTVAPVTPQPSTDGIVRVAIPASTMKLNPKLFEIIAEIGRRVQSKVEFQFFPLAGTGLPYFELAKVVKERVPFSTVFLEAPHDVYVERLARCDLFLCPFPYGNMNSIIDAFRIGLSGVCLDGPEAHAHADAAIFARVGLPAELAAKTMDDYVTQAVRMIDDAEFRRSTRDIVASADLEGAFFKGDASLFAKAMADLIEAAGG